MPRQLDCRLQRREVDPIDSLMQEWERQYRIALKRGKAGGHDLMHVTIRVVQELELGLPASSHKRLPPC